MKKKILVKIQDYKKYIEKYGSNKLDPNNEIYTNSQFPKFLNIKEEININEYSIKEVDNKIILSNSISILEFNKIKN